MKIITPTKPALPGQKTSGKTARRKRTSAFTLVEVMMASVVLIFGICSCFGVIQQSFAALDTARNSTLAAQVMQSEIERLRLMNWTDLSALTGANQTVNVSNTFSSNAQMANKFTANRTIAAADGRTDMMEITITVRWNGANGMQHTRSFMTRYSKNGLYDYFYTARS